ncbi:MAG: type II toxin-antitoxin system VapC family toxin [Thermodesulfobacteriota bacterium]
MDAGVGSMTPGYLFDSDILIYHINDQLDAETKKYLVRLLEQPVHISVISRIEVLGWAAHTYESWRTTNELIQSLREIRLDEDVVEETIKIRRKVRMKTPDAIIAASALVHSLTLVTRNLEDFARVTGLSTVNPFAVREQIK